MNLSIPYKTNAAPPRRGRLRPTGSASRLAEAAAALLAVACILTAAGCAGGKDEIREVAVGFVEAIKSQDPASFEELMDWERYYAQGNKEGEDVETMSSEDVENQKSILLSVLARDRVLSLRYRTAENTVRNISIDGKEARAEIYQVDRATGETRIIELLLTKSDGWKIYRFSTEEAQKD